MLLAWDALLGLALLLWVSLRVQYRRVLAQWNRQAKEEAEAEAQDEWGATRRSQWQV